MISRGQLLEQLFLNATALPGCPAGWVIGYGSGWAIGYGSGVARATPLGASDGRGLRSGISSVAERVRQTGGGEARAVPHDKCMTLCLRLIGSKSGKNVGNVCSGFVALHAAISSPVQVAFTATHRSESRKAWINLVLVLNRN